MQSLLFHFRWSGYLPEHQQDVVHWLESGTTTCAFTDFNISIITDFYRSSLTGAILLGHCTGPIRANRSKGRTGYGKKRNEWAF